MLTFTCFAYRLISNMNQNADAENKHSDDIEILEREEAAYTKTLHKKYLGIRKRYWVIGLLVAAIVLTTVLVVFRDTLARPETFSSLGPLGLFLFCLASNATVILPVGAVFAVILAPEVFSITPVIASIIGRSVAALMSRCSSSTVKALRICLWSTFSEAFFIPERRLDTSRPELTQ